MLCSFDSSMEEAGEVERERALVGLVTEEDDGEIGIESLLELNSFFGRGCSLVALGISSLLLALGVGMGRGLAITLVDLVGATGVTTLGKLPY